MRRRPAGRARARRNARWRRRRRSPKAGSSKATSCSRSSRSSPALAAYRKAVETKPDQVPAHYMIVTLLMQDGKIEEARKQLDGHAEGRAEASADALSAGACSRTATRTMRPRAMPSSCISRRPPTACWACCSGRRSTTSSGPTPRPSRRSCSRAAASCRNTRMRAGCWSRSYLREGKPAKALEAMKPLCWTIAAGFGHAGPGRRSVRAERRYGRGRAVLRKGGGARSQEHGKRTAVALSHLPKGERSAGSTSWRRWRPKTPESGRTSRWSRRTSGRRSSTRRWPRSPRSRRSSRTSRCRTTCADRFCSPSAMSRARDAASSARSTSIRPTSRQPRTSRDWTSSRRSRRTRRSASTRSWPRIRRTCRRSSRSPACALRPEDRRTKSPR